jgi:shikimate kinase
MSLPEAPTPDAPPMAWHGRPIVLVGHMGSGKTSIGKRLAARLALDFVDADAEIELAAGMSVAEIFARFGEPGFRDGERRVIARLVAGPVRVIATGGGAFIDPATRALVRDRALSIWLDADLATLVARTAKRGHRPLLAGRDPAEVLGELAVARNPCYAQATLRVASNNTAHDHTVAAILAALEALPR